jgi:ferritin heavy chain
MLLKAAPAFSLLNPPRGETLGPLCFSVSPSSCSVSPLNSSASLASTLRFSSAKKDSGAVICAASKGANHRPLTGVVFEPVEAVKKELDLVPTVPQDSLARQKYCNEAEAAINEQIKWDFCLVFIALNILHVCEFIGWFCLL